MHEFAGRVEERQQVTMVHLAGSTESGRFVELAATLARLIREQSPHIVLDCRSVRHINSTQVKRLLELAAFARECGGDIKCVGLAPAIRDVADALASGNSLECFDEVTQAESAFCESAPRKPIHTSYEALQRVWRTRRPVGETPTRTIGNNGQ